MCHRSPVGLVALLTCSLECFALVTAMLPDPPSDPMPVRAAQVPSATASSTNQHERTELAWATGLPGTSLSSRPNATALDRATPVGSAHVGMLPQVSDPREALAFMAREAQHRGHLPCIYPCLMPAIVDHDNS